MKVSEASGPALDWMAAKCEGYTHLRRNPHRFSSERELIMAPPRASYGPVLLADLAFSTVWSQGGPIIEREEICIKRQKPCSIGYEWNAWSWTKNSGPGGSGPTPLVAAMRCYVASVLGTEVEVPEELV